MSIKNKTLIFIVLILVFFSVAILFVVKMQQDEDLKMFQNKYYENTKYLYEKISKKYENFYTETILYDSTSMDVKEAIKSKDKERLYKLLATKYLTLQKENPALLTISFYLPDNTVLLKIAQQDDTYKVQRRNLIEKVHKNKTAVFGFEQYENSVAYKIIHPIFYGQEYLGALELGVSIGYILKDIEDYTNMEGATFVQNNLNLYGLKYKTLKDIKLLENLSHTDKYNANTTMQTRMGKVYSIYSFDVNNYNNTTIAKIYLFNNITKEVAKFKKDKLNISFFLISMIVITIIVINFVLGRSVKGLQDSYDSLSEYSDMVNENVMIADTSLNGTIIGVSRRFCEVSEYTQEELLGQPFEIIKHHETLKKTYETIYETLQADGQWSGDLKNQTKDGKVYWLNTVIQAKKRDGKLFCYNYIMHDITDRKLNEELLLTDELTNLYNRRYFNDMFPRIVKSVKRNGGYLNFIVLDVDDFKNYNDIYGHAKGDEALKIISNVLSKSLRRPDDYCFRLGGAEFGIIYRTVKDGEGSSYAQVLKKNIEMAGIKHEGNIVYKVLTASLGLVSIIGENIVDEKDIYKLAYEHLYRAKENGRNKIVSKLV